MRISERARSRSTARSSSPSEPFYRPNWSVYRYDPARSRRLLEQAGCRRGADGIYLCAGERLRLRFFTTAGSPSRELAVQLMRTQLRQAGVEVDPIYAPAGALFGTILPGGNFDAALFGWGVNPGGTVMPETKCGDPQNWTGYCNRLAMRDLQQADRILAPALRARALDAGDRKVVRDVPALPLFQGMIRVALKKTIRGFEPGGTSSTSSRTPRTGGSSALALGSAGAAGVLERLREVPGLGVVVGEPLVVLLE